MRDEKFYENQLKNPLSYEEITKIIDKYVEFTDKWNLGRSISFTGGDPLLREDFFDILRYCKGRSITIGILGNPFHITERTASKLERLGVSSYQLSIDGMEKIHDELRSKGSFKDTLRSLEILNKTNIKTHIMFTISKKNRNDLFDIIDFVAKNNIDVFAFTRLIPIGSGKSFLNDLFSAEEYRDLLLRVFDKYRIYKERGYKTYFARKSCDPWVFLERDLGLLKTSDLEKKKDMFLSRCPIEKHIAILADGTVLACRKLPIKIGKFPEQSFEEIMSSEEFNNILKNRCINSKSVPRGCAAMSYATTGDIRNPDINCW